MWGAHHHASLEKRRSGRHRMCIVGRGSCRGNKSDRAATLAPLKKSAADVTNGSADTSNDARTTRLALPCQIAHHPARRRRSRSVRKQFCDQLRRGRLLSRHRRRRQRPSASGVMQPFQRRFPLSLNGTLWPVPSHPFPKERIVRELPWPAQNDVFRCSHTSNEELRESHVAQRVHARKPQTMHR